MTAKQWFVWLLCFASGGAGMVIGIWSEDSHWERRAINAESELQVATSLWEECYERVLYVCDQGVWPATLCRLDDYHESQYCTRCSGSSMGWVDHDDPDTKASR
jgi:hypothetical protein